MSLAFRKHQTRFGWTTSPQTSAVGAFCPALRADLPAGSIEFMDSIFHDWKKRVGEKLWSTTDSVILLDLLFWGLGCVFQPRNGRRVGRSLDSAELVAGQTEHRPFSPGWEKDFLEGDAPSSPRLPSWGRRRRSIALQTVFSSLRFVPASEKRSWKKQPRLMV